MKTAVLSEHLVRFKTMELNLRTREPHRNGLKLKLQGHPIIVPGVQRAHDFPLALFEVLTLGSLPKETTYN
ncbi:MAG TPA: hypothetical protein VGE83_00745 [Terracidiphilus sp.]|jgi:hypothetical protein